MFSHLEVKSSDPETLHEMTLLVNWCYINKPE